MKNLKRFLAIFFVASLMLTSTVFADTDFNYDEAAVKESVKEFVSDFMQMDELEYQYYVDNSTGWTIEASEKMLSYIQSDTLGSYVSLSEVKIKEDGKTLKASLTATYMKGSLDVVTTLASINGSISVIGMEITLADTIEAPFGERMANAAFNTLIGISSVFLVLLLICFIISLFKYIPKLQEMFGKKKKGSAEAALESAIAQIEEKEELVDDTELIAVITAAICASTGASSDSFVVRSIKKANRKKKYI